MSIIDYVKRALAKPRRRRNSSSKIESLEPRVLISGTSPGMLPGHFHIHPPGHQQMSSVEYYSIDGTGNNLADPQQGSTHEQLMRMVSIQFADQISLPMGDDLPGAREVSNAVVAQDESIVNERGLSDFIWMWGQFIDHDLDLTEGADPTEEFNIPVPMGDPWFDPYFTGEATIGLSRSLYDHSSGHSADNPRQQVNEITAYLDGSVIYGSDEARANALREFAGGRLLVSDGNLLPFNVDGYANAGGTSDQLFLAGDVRANENLALSSMHTIWVREHNRIAGEIADHRPGLSDQEIYLQARAIVTAELQAITYNEFLPALLGKHAISQYEGYDPTVDVSIGNVFSTAAYRLGHSLLSSELMRLDADGEVIDDGNILLQNAFFNPQELIDQGIDSLLRGAATQQAQELDPFVIDDVRNFLFGPPGSGGFDLASLNIQRGRDHGLPRYNQARIDMRLAPVQSWADISSNPIIQQRLASVYESVDDIDLWVGGLAEDHVRGSSVGELFQSILVHQFERIRNGDRLWYQNQFSGAMLQRIEHTTLADVIERNSAVTGLQKNIFFVEQRRPDRPDHGRFCFWWLSDRKESKPHREEFDRNDRLRNERFLPPRTQQQRRFDNCDTDRDNHDSRGNSHSSNRKR